MVHRPDTDVRGQSCYRMFEGERLHAGARLSRQEKLANRSNSTDTIEESRL